MAKIYYKRIKAGTMELGDVPSTWRFKVEKMLEKDANEN